MIGYKIRIDTDRDGFRVYQVIELETGWRIISTKTQTDALRVNEELNKLYRDLQQSRQDYDKLYIDAIAGW